MNAFLDNGLCEDELNHGDCMFDGFDCCGYDRTNDGDYDDLFEIGPGDKSFCTECLCKGMCKFKGHALVFAIHFDSRDEIQIKLVKLH